MSYYVSVIKDSPIGFWKLDEVQGPTAYDYSGCQNNASYINFVHNDIFPLVSQGSFGTIIDENSYIEYPIQYDYYGSQSGNSFATEDTSDNDFTLEVWFNPKNLNSETAILGGTIGVGIFWDKGNILFSLGTEELNYTLPNPNKTIHIVAIYKKGSMSLHVDGYLVRFKKLNNFKFSNSSLLLQSGPCVAGDSFVIDAPAVYRYSLNENQIRSHYIKANSVSDSQIASINGGNIFRATEKHQSETDKFIFPSSKNWQYMLGSDLSYDETKNSIYLSANKTYGSFVEAISLSVRKNYISSKIEWLGSYGVKVYCSTDESSWTECENGSSLPDINNKKIIYIKVDFESTDSNVYTPELYYLNIFFYTEKKLYSHNGVGYIEAAPGEDIDISNKEYSVLNRAKNNGIKCKSSGFKLNILEDILDLEFILTPESLGSGYLLYNLTENTEYSLSWASGGLISMPGVSELHINGQDASGATDISQHLNIGEPNHIFIKLEGPITGDIWFNVKHSGGVSSENLPNNLYKNITVYNNNNSSPLANYNLYLGNNSVQVEDSSLTLSELDTLTYSPDWINISKV